MRRRIIDAATLQPSVGRARHARTLSATPAETAMARQMARTDRREELAARRPELNRQGPWNEESDGTA